MVNWQKRLELAKNQSTCRITTRGRRTGKPHTVTIWFVAGEIGRIYLGTLKLGRDWPKNVAANPEVVIEIGDLKLKGEARRVSEPSEIERIASLIAGKYWAAWLASWFGMKPQGVFAVEVRGEP
jgi:deazaflavin-dependent oxidoreductase (nitroreductase family)